MYDDIYWFRDTTLHRETEVLVRTRVQQTVPVNWNPLASSNRTVAVTLATSRPPATPNEIHDRQWFSLADCSIGGGVVDLGRGLRFHILAPGYEVELTGELHDLEAIDRLLSMSAGFSEAALKATTMTNSPDD